MRKLRFVSLAVLLTVVVFGVMIFLLRSNYYIENLSQYGSPICRADKHKFVGEECSECGSPIKTHGMFVKKLMNEEYKYEIESDDDRTMEFNKHYKSYKDFKKDYNSASVLASVYILLLLVFVFGWIGIIYKLLGIGKKKEKSDK